MSETEVMFVRQWIAKADADWKTVEILLASGDPPAESICFHCQQYVEKILKALLVREGIEFPKTHDLRRLVQLASPSVPELDSLIKEADSLSFHGVQSRYPDDWREIEEEEVRDLVKAAEKFKRILQPVLDPPRSPRDLSGQNQS